MKNFKKHKLLFLVVALLLVAFLISRLYNILLIPLFTDEAIYVRWSQIARYDASWRFISLTDGKQPSFVWLTMIMMRFISDPLLAGRLVSVGAGLVTMIGLTLLAREVFKSLQVGFITALIYLIFPIALIYDRMALYDSLVGVFTIWSLYFSVILVRKLRLDVALILGMVIGGGLLTKSSGIFNIYLLPFTLLLFDWCKKERWARFLKWVGLAGIVTVESFAYQAALRLSPFFHIIGEKNRIFVYSFTEWQAHPFEFFQGNFLGLWDWFTTYLTWPQVILIFLSFIVFLKFTKEKILLFIWFVVPFIALAFFGKVLYPRFIFFMILPLLPLLALSLFKISQLIKNKALLTMAYFLLLFLTLRTDFLILTNPAVATIPKADLNQYLNDWPAGGGIAETIDFLSKVSEKQKIYVASEGTFGSLPTYAVEIYLGDNKNVDKRGIWPPPKEIPTDLLEKAQAMPVYFIFNQEQNPPQNWPLGLIARYQKGVGNSYLSLYQVIAQKE